MKRSLLTIGCLAGLPLAIGGFARLVVQAYHGDAPVTAAIVVAIVIVGLCWPSGREAQS